MEATTEATTEAAIEAAIEAGMEAAKTWGRLVIQIAGAGAVKRRSVAPPFAQWCRLCSEFSADADQAEEHRSEQHGCAGDGNGIGADDQVLEVAGRIRQSKIRHENLIVQAKA